MDALHSHSVIVLQAVLTEYMEAARKPTLIMLQSPWQPHRLTSHLPALNDFPICMAAVVSRRDQAHSSTF
jgi:hypothetical protein